MHPHTGQGGRAIASIGLRTPSTRALVATVAAACLSLHCASGEVVDSDGAVTFSSNAPEIGKLVGQDGVFCSGTLIAPTVVLTAAHCVLDLEGPIAFTVYSPQGGQRWGFDVARAEYNPAYDDGSYVHDVGLMKLSVPVPSEIAEPRGMTNAVTPPSTPMTIWGYSSKATSNLGDTQKHYASFDWPAKTTLIWLGDSGGPVIRMDTREISRVVSGILDNSYVAIDLSAPLSANWEWVQSTKTLLE